jgi:phosphoglycerate dehydrogenase-like enzyme
MKDGALFINSARGWLVDEQALVRHLEIGRIRAILDVYEHEPLKAGDKLVSAPNVILSPHAGMGSFIHEYARVMINEIDRFLAGKEPRYEINADRWARMTDESLTG